MSTEKTCVLGPAIDQVSPSTWAQLVNQIQRDKPRNYWVAAIMVSAIVGLLSIAVTLNVRNEGYRLAERSVLTVANISKSKIESEFTHLDALLKTTGQRYQKAQSEGRGAVDTLTEQLDVELREYALASRIGITDSTGSVVFNSAFIKNRHQTITIADRDYFKNAVLGEENLQFSGPVQAKLDGAWSLVMSRRISGGNGQFLGLIFVSIPIERLEEWLLLGDLGEHGTINIRTQDLAQVARVPKLSGADNGLGNRNLSKTARDLLQANPQANQITYRAVAPIDGVERIYCYVKFDRYPLWMSAGRAANESDAQWKLIGLVLGLFTAVLTVLLLWGAKKLQSHLLDLNAQVVEQTEAIRKKEEFLRMITDAVPGMIGYWDKSLHNRFANSEYRDWFGKSPDEILGMHMRDLLGPALFQKNELHIQSVLSGQAQQFESTLKKPDGTVHHTLVQYIPDISEGVVQGFYVLVLDVTALEVAKQSAEAANNAKSTFLATTSHEIRTPLNAIVGMTYLLGKTPLNAEQHEQVATIQTSSKNLLALINDVLDISKIEAGELQLEQVGFSLPALLDELRQLYGGMAASKNLTLSIPSPLEEIPDVLEGDVNRLRQMLLNYLSNALKFTDYGSIGLHVSLLARNDSTSSVQLRFEVTDSGIGIPLEVQSQLFLPFSQADTGISRRYGGTGLGLSIVKQLAERMGGRVGIVSTPEHGSKFWFEVCLKVAPQQLADEVLARHFESPVDLPSEEYYRLQGAKVMVVDDSTTNLDVCYRILALEGAEITLCSSGQEAIEAIQTSEIGFDLVLMDIQMPNMTGLEATRKIRAMEKGTLVPIIALTAGATTSDRQEAQEAGMMAFLPKPIDPQNLILCIRTELQRVRGTDWPLFTRNAATEPSTSIPRVPGIDVHQAAKILGNNLALFMRILRTLRDEFGQLEQELHTLIQKGDRRTAAQRLHKMRGIAASAGADTLASAAATLEAMLVENQTDAQLEPLLSKVCEALAVILTNLPEGIDMVSEVAKDETPIDLQELDALKAALQSQKFSAKSLFKKLEPRLRARVSAAAASQLSDAMEQLNFKRALEILEGWNPEI